MRTGRSAPWAARSGIAECSGPWSGVRFAPTPFEGAAHGIAPRNNRTASVILLPVLVAAGTGVNDLDPGHRPDHPLPIRLDSVGRGIGGPGGHRAEQSPSVRRTPGLHAGTCGPLATFGLHTKDEWHGFRVGVELHDCGEITTPEHVFEVRWRDTEIERLRAWASDDDPAAVRTRCAAQRVRLQDDLTFIAQCNLRGENLSQSHRDRIQQIGAAAHLACNRVPAGRPAPPRNRLRDLQPVHRAVAFDQFMLSII